MLNSFLFLLGGLLCLSPPDSVKPESQKVYVKVLPNGYYRPETRAALGVFTLITFRSVRTDTSSRLSYVRSSLVVTQNKQIASESDWQIFTRGEKYINSGSLDVMKFPEYFFGIGNNTKEDDAVLYSMDRISLYNTYLLRKLNNKNFAGLNLNTQYLFNPSARYSLGKYSNLAGAQGYFANGIGPTFLFDNRDNVLNTRKGTYLEFSISFNSKYTLSQHAFTNYIFNYRKFILIKNRLTWANDLYASFTSGSVPFRSYPTLGGFRFLRGYYTGRFRDRQLIFAQTEFRLPLFWRIGIVGFAGVGQVAHRMNGFEKDEFKFTGGGGLRFKLSLRDNVNVRIDYGFSDEGGGLYMVFSESF